MKKLSKITHNASGVNQDANKKQKKLSFRSPGIQIQGEAPAIFPGGFFGNEFILLYASFCLFLCGGKVAPAA